MNSIKFSLFILQTDWGLNWTWRKGVKISSDFQVSEGHPLNDVVSNIETSDPDRRQSFSYKLLSNTDQFKIEGNSLLVSGSLDFSYFSSSSFSSSLLNRRAHVTFVRFLPAHWSSIWLREKFEIWTGNSDNRQFLLATFFHREAAFEDQQCQRETNQYHF